MKNRKPLVSFSLLFACQRMARENPLAFRRRVECFLKKEPIIADFIQKSATLLLGRLSKNLPPFRSITMAVQELTTAIYISHLAMETGRARFWRKEVAGYTDPSLAQGTSTGLGKEFGEGKPGGKLPQEWESPPEDDLPF